MRNRLAQAALAAALLAGASPPAHAQLATEDPGRAGSAPSGLGPSAITTESGTTVFRGAGTAGGSGYGSGTGGGATGTTAGSGGSATVFHGAPGGGTVSSGPANYGAAPPPGAATGAR
jgi:hypothetical protein